MADTAEISVEEGPRWLSSFLSVRRPVAYHPDDAPPAGAAQRAALRAGLPAGVLLEVNPDRSLQPV